MLTVQMTAGFKTVDDYYKAASSAQRVGDVKVPLLVIQAADDPIAPIAGTPKQALHDNPNCILAGAHPPSHSFTLFSQLLGPLCICCG